MRGEVTWKHPYQGSAEDRKFKAGPPESVRSRLQAGSPREFHRSVSADARTSVRQRTTATKRRDIHRIMNVGALGSQPSVVVARAGPLL